ncbi:AfsR/SARP family transcriptional regulator [Kribbella sp. NBC_01505]|uniref:AfsR/SARP family transcriptional regulator n=1 Tax=Kribbella sp. NBC_01505 TaxID=2903580 RepID=UPI003863E9E3
MAAPSYDVLGPLVVRRNGVDLDLGPELQQRILAGLLLQPNAPVPMTDLLEAGWRYAIPDDAPEQARAVIASLRELLDPQRVPGTEGALIQLTDGRYMLCANRIDVDLFVFEENVRSGRAAHARGHLPDAAEFLRRALDLWRGDFLEGQSGPLFDTGRAQRQESRLEVLDELFVIELGRGVPDAVLPDLANHVARHPLRENARASFLLALYRTGRQYDALQQFEEISARLQRVEGREPSLKLRELAARIARQDPTLLTGPTPAAVPLPVGDLPVPSALTPAWAGAVAVAPAPAVPGIPRPPRWQKVALKTGSALVPFVTFGLGSWVAMVALTIQRRNPWLLIPAAGYLVTGIGWLFYPENVDWPLDVAFIAMPIAAVHLAVLAGSARRRWWPASWWPRRRLG